MGIEKEKVGSHYVPKAYLKEFENLEIRKLFTLKIKGKYPSSKVKMKLSKT